jgi:hypothetical protein
VLVELTMDKKSFNVFFVFILMTCVPFSLNTPKVLAEGYKFLRLLMPILVFRKKAI